MKWRDLPLIGDFMDWYRPQDNRGLVPIAPPIPGPQKPSDGRKSRPSVQPERMAQIRMTQTERLKIYQLFQQFAPEMAAGCAVPRTQEWMVGAFHTYQCALKEFPQETSWFFAHRVLPSLAPEKRVQAYHFWRDDPLTQRWASQNPEQSRRITLRMIAAFDPAHMNQDTRILTGYDVGHPDGNRITATISPTGPKGAFEMGVVSLPPTAKGSIFIGNAQELAGHWRVAGQKRDPQSIALAEAFWGNVDQYPYDPAARQLVLGAARAIDIRPTALQPKPWGAPI